uniref:Uncharacterized protein n=1 Tax=Anguilla anguilla TaxID=7936 RepID=A0A0E9PV76_ANGAN
MFHIQCSPEKVLALVLTHSIFYSIIQIYTVFFKELKIIHEEKHPTKYITGN